jgi:hypothetical protein
MSAPVSSKLDGSQVLQAVLDETTGRLRVDAEISASIITPPGLEVSISASDDNIAIRNSNNNNELLIEADGSINVNAVFPSSIAVTQSTSPWVISGMVTANIGTSGSLALDSSLSTINTSINTLLKPASTLTKVTTVDTITNVVHIDDNSGSITIDGTVNAAQSGTWNINNISGTISLPTGAATESTLSTLNSKIPSGLTVSSTRLLVDGSGVTLTVSGTVAATQSGTWNIGTLSTITNVVHIDDNSGSITIDGTVAATQSGAWNITNISGTVSLPTGAATAANQATEIASLVSIDSKLTSPISISVPSPDVSGSLTSTQNVTLDIAGMATVWLHLEGTFVGSGSFRGSIDGTNYFDIFGASLVDLNGNIFSTFTESDIPIDFKFNVSGLSKFRIVYAHTSGTLNYQIGSSLANDVLTGITSTIYSGQAGSWHVSLDAGSNSIGILGANSGVDIGDVTINAGSAIIGKVGIDQTTPGTTNLVALAANQSVNNAQINGVTPLMGNGVTGTGSQRVTIASDNTAFSVNATLQTGTNGIGKLTANSGVTIGAVEIAAAQTLATVTTVSTVTAVTSITNALPAGSNAIGKLAANAGVNIGDTNIIDTRITYIYEIPSQVHVAGANTIHWDLFNADAALVVHILGIYQIPNITTAVTGIVFDWQLFRTSAVGTGGSAVTAWLPDLSQTALDVDITLRTKPTGGATTSGNAIKNYSISSEETNTATQEWNCLATGGMLNLVPLPLQNYGGIVLRQNQGIKCVQVTNSNAGNTGWYIAFHVT